MVSERISPPWISAPSLENMSANRMVVLSSISFTAALILPARISFIGAVNIQTGLSTSRAGILLPEASSVASISAKFRFWSWVLPHLSDLVPWLEVATGEGVGLTSLDSSSVKYNVRFRDSCFDGCCSWRSVINEQALYRSARSWISCRNTSASHNKQQPRVYLLKFILWVLFRAPVLTAKKQ